MLRIFVVLLVSAAASAYKILVFFPFAGKSHGILGDGYVRALLKDGQKVTYATPFPETMKHVNLTIVDLSDNLKHMQTDKMNMTKILNKELNIGSQITTIMLRFANGTLSNPNLQALMSDPKATFDLVIAEWMTSEAYFGLGPIFNAPFILSMPTVPNWMTLQLIDDLPNPSYTVDSHSADATPFNFQQRAKQLFNRLAGIIMKTMKIESQDEEIYLTHFTAPARSRGIVLPSFDEARFNASLMLANSHPSLSESITLPQSCKLIGGYHVDTDSKPLPQNLQKIMDESKDGVIYFSMGSVLKSESLPQSIKKDFLKLFGKLKQTVLWKFEDDTLTDIPKNVHILKWAPQTSILNHPNTRLFITHGGLLSTIESVHFGVPIIGLPVFGDQFLNVARSSHRGFAMKVDWSYEVAEDLEMAIYEILNNPKYMNRVKELSFIYHDRVVPPGVELAHWARHVIETGGAPVLRSQALALAWYQRYYVNLLLVFILIGFLARYGFRKLVEKFCGKKKVKTN